MVACNSQIKCIDITKHFISYSFTFDEKEVRKGRAIQEALAGANPAGLSAKTIRGQAPAESYNKVQVI